MFALKRAEKLATKRKQNAAVPTVSQGQTSQPEAEDPVTRAGFGVGPVDLEKVKGSSLVYATGTLTSLTNRQRYGVKIELDLLDGSGKKVGQAKDYQQVMEPNGQWHFKALVVDSKAASAKVASVKEDQ